jgi:hypothetical protein
MRAMPSASTSMRRVWPGVTALLRAFIGAR